MAIIIPGKSRCCICGDVIRVDVPSKGFPPFTSDPNDELFLFSDSSCHLACLNPHTASQIEAKIRNSRIDYKKCQFCGYAINTVKELVQTPILSNDCPELSGLDSLNVHKKCFIEHGCRDLIVKGLTRLIQLKQGHTKKYKPLLQEIQSMELA